MNATLKIMASGLFFNAAALTDLARNQDGIHRLVVGPMTLTLVAVALLAWGIFQGLCRQIAAARRKMEPQ